VCLDPKIASVALAKLQNPVKQSFDSVNTDLKEVYKALGNYSKALDKARVPRSLNPTSSLTVHSEIQRQAFADY